MVAPFRLPELLAEANPAISLYLPIDPAERDVRAPAARLRGLIRRADSALEERGFDVRERARLLEPAWGLAQGETFVEHRDRGLAVFLAAGRITAMPLTETPPEVATVGHVFQLRPLLPLIERNRHFYVLALGSDRARLFVTTPQSLEEVPIDDLLPPALAAQADSLPAGDLAVKHTRLALLAHNLPALATAVRKRLGGDPAGLVLIAQSDLAGRFMATASLPQLVEPPVITNPFALSEQQLRSLALARIAPRLDADRGNALNNIRARLGAGEPTASNRIEDILVAARDGRVAAMILAEDAMLWGTFDPTSGSVSLQDEDSAGAEDLANLAAVLTLRQGGRVFTLPRDELPGEAGAVAAFRW